MWEAGSGDGRWRELWEVGGCVGGEVYCWEEGGRNYSSQYVLAGSNEENVGAAEGRSTQRSQHNGRNHCGRRHVGGRSI